MDKYIYDFMAATIEVAVTNPMAPYGAIIVYDDKEILLKSVNLSLIHL
ncbi:nucleoside deaminase, partial [Legionella pneumophila]